MEHIRIAIRDSTDSMNICFLDNKAGIKFHEATLQRFLKGTCNFLTLKFYGKDIDTIYPGCRLAFKYAGNDYWLTINSFEKNGYECSLTAYSLSLETNKEKRKAYKAQKWTFKQYLDYVDPEHSLMLGLNEVASQSMQLEWSGTDTILARLFSIANSFGAELEFVTELNDDYSLKRHVLNVYKVGNIGKDKTGMPIRVGKSLKVINYTANIDELYTAIRVHGKDGLTIAGLDKKVYDSDKKLLYYTQGDTLYAPQARDRFPAIAHKASDSFICLESEDTEHSSKEALYAYMLGELKKHSEPKIDYETEGYVDGEIGDRMLLIDSVHYDPPLYVEARISEQTISLLDKSKNKTVFTNYERKKSEIANELLAKMTALIEENKTYDVQILTSNGYSFKNGFGETTLTARVMDGAKDVTSEFSLTWFKNSTEYAHTASINVQAGSIDELATYLIIAEKDGRERGRNELTVFNVKDGSPGKTPVVHLAWADSSDGSVGFSLELPTDKIPKYRGYYVDYSTVASTNPKLYKWERNPDDAAKVADEAKDKADIADSKADSAIDAANTAKDTADEASKQTALVNSLANTAKDLADKANADATEANRLIGLANTEIGKLNTNVENTRKDLASAESDLSSKIETVKTTVTNDYAKKTELSDTKLTLNKTISESVASVKQEMSEKYSTKNDLTTLQGEYNSFKEETAKKFSQQVSSIQTIQTDTTEAQRLANDALSKASSAVTSANNASSTASSAMTKASDATNVANSASQNATNAVASANSAVSTANTAKSNADKAIADVAALTQTVSSQSTRIDQTSSRIEQVASGVTEVGNKLDNLQVGGRNLIIGTSEEFVMGYGIPNTTWENGRAILRYGSGNDPFKTTEILPQNSAFDDFVMKPGATYTQSIIVETDATFIPNGEFYFSWYRMSPETHNSQRGSIKKTGNEQYLIWSTTSVDEDNYRLRAFDIINLQKVLSFNNSGSYIAFSKPKLEEGNVPTAWSPAPEDQQSQIDGINSNLSNNYYQKTTVDSKLSTAVSGITAQYKQDITTKLGNYYDKSTIDSKLTIDGQGIASYVKSTQSKLDNLQIGGRNLIIGTSEEFVMGYGIPNTTWENGRAILRYGSGNDPFKTTEILPQNSAFDDFVMKPGATYTQSIIVETDATFIPNGEFYFSWYRMSPETHNSQRGSIKKTGNEQYLIWSTTSVDEDNYRLRAFDIINLQKVLSFNNSGSYIAFSKPKLEEGNVPTAWSPAPEDMATTEQYTEVKQLADQLSAVVYDSSVGLVTKTTQLANSYAIKQLNSAGDILTSLNLNANNQSAEINAKLIRLNGYTKIDDAFINNLVTNSILTNKIKATEISGDYIKGGTIQGVKIISNNGPGNVTLNYGRIDMDLIEPIEPNVNRNSIGTFTPSYVTMASYIDRGSTPQLDGSVMLDYTGFTSRIKDDDGTIQNRRIEFNSEGFRIYPIDASSNALNSGIRLFGRHAYLDLNGNKTTKTKGTVSRIISGPDGSMQIINNDGNIYMMTKNGEQPIANGYKLIYTWGSPNDMSVRHIRMVNSSSSSPYAEIQNNAGTAFGMNVWKSDQRLKSNIQSPTQDALATINQLQVRQFDWKSDNVHEDFGLVAQEVEQVLPNAVFKVGDYYQIKDSGLIPVLIGAVQKLSNKVNLLENIIYNTKGGNLI